MRDYTSSTQTLLESPYQQQGEELITELFDTYAVQLKRTSALQINS